MKASQNISLEWHGEESSPGPQTADPCFGWQGGSGRFLGSGDRIGIRLRSLGWVMAAVVLALVQVVGDAVSYSMVGGGLTRGGSTDFAVSVPDGAFVDQLEFRFAGEVGGDGFMDYLDVSLISPSGTTVRLLASSLLDDETGVLEGLSLEDTIFSEDGAVTIEDGAPPYSGRYKVDGWTAGTGLARFRGQRAGGVWILRVRDVGSSGGTLFGTGNASSAGWSTLGSALLITPLPTEQQPPTLVAASDSGPSSVDAITNDSTPTFTGVAAAGSSVVLMKGSTSLGTAVAAGDGRWTITSVALSEGNHSIRAIATRGASVVETLAQAVVIDLTPPALTQPADTETDEEVVSSPVKFVVSDNLTSVANLTVSGSCDPAVLVEKIVAGGTGAARNVVVYPATGRTGTGVVRVVVTDLAGNTAQQTFNLIVIDVNKAPVLEADTLTRVAGERVVKVRASALLANDTDSDGDTLMIDSVSAPLPSGAAVAISGEFVVYSVPAGTSGGGSFVYTVSDGLGGHLVGRVVTVIEGAGSGASDLALPVSVLVDGRDALLTWLGIPRRTYRVQYTTSIGAPYVWREFSPSVELSAARSGIVGLFTHRDINPPESSRLYRAVPVGWDNVAPVAVPDTVQRLALRREISVPSASLLANDTDADLDVLQIVSVGEAQPAGSTVAIDGASILYTAPLSNEGPGSFEYEVSDGAGGHRVKTTVTVEKVD